MPLSDEKIKKLLKDAKKVHPMPWSLRAHIAPGSNEIIDEDGISIEDPFYTEIADLLAAAPGLALEVLELRKEIRKYKRESKT